MIEISVNETLVITLIVVLWILHGLRRIIGGILKSERNLKYDKTDIAFGIVQIILVFIVLLF